MNLDFIRSEGKELYIVDQRSLIINDYCKVVYLESIQDGLKKKELKGRSPVST